MPLSIDSALGLHDDALMLKARRSELLASNLANADTPGYKARDIDFKAALVAAQQEQGVTLRATHASHVQPAGNGLPVDALYRVPNQPSLDGNTVDTRTEQAAFAQNAVEYEASLMFLNRKINGVMKALRGE